MAVPTYLNNEQGSKQVSGQYTEAGGSEFVSAMQVDPTGSGLSIDKSYTIPVQDKFKNLIQTNGEGMTFKTPADMGFFAGVNYFESIAGDKQAVHGGDSHAYTQGNETKQTGEAGPKQVEAAKNLQQATRAIDAKKIDTIKNTKGSQVECPVCSSELLSDKNQCLIDLAFKILRFSIPFLPHALDIFQKYLNMLITPFKTPKKVSEYNGGKGCGSPGCKNGMVDTPQKAVQQANKEAANELKSKQKQIGQYQQDSGAGGTHTMGPFMGDVALHVGAPGAMNDAPTVAKNGHHVIAFGQKNDPNGDGLFPHTEGSTERAVHSPPLVNAGSLFLGVNEKFTLAAGSPGIDVHTTGKMELRGAVTTISASEGELNLQSANLTTLKGKNIIIDGKDGSGDNGVRIEADNVMVAGALNVTGNMGLKGSLTLDGGFHCTHITCPGERVSTGPTNSANTVHLGANWNNPESGMKATLMNLRDMALKVAGRDLADAITFNMINGSQPLTTKVMESYDKALLAVPVDNMGMPTGYAETYFAPPGAPAGPPLMVEGSAFVISDYTGSPLPVIFDYTFVTPGQTLPVFNFPHNHGTAGDQHSHDYTNYVGHQPATATAARSVAPQPNHVPVPAKSTGMGSKPGHKSIGGLCIPCIPLGGGGGGNAINKAYNLPQDPFNGTNYVQADANFNPDGTMNPLPMFDPGCP
jgi:hypothetical protein